MKDFTIFGRRRVLQGAGGMLAAASLPLRARASKTIKVGFVSPQTGPLALFGAVDRFVVGQLRTLFEARGIELDVRDSQSDPNRAANVANDLINSGVALMLTGWTPETTNPVSDQCELAGVPCVSTATPWQSWFFNRGGVPGKGFTWTYHFFWGLEQVLATYTGMWAQLPSAGKTVGGLFANDGDGHAWTNKTDGFPPVLKAKGYKLIDPGRYQDGTSDFSSEIHDFKAGNAGILTGNVLPPDFTTFWNQAQQQGYKPTIATIGKALCFPESVNILGDAGNNLSCEVWWTPAYPFISSLTGQTARQYAGTYEKVTGKQWTQPIGYTHALLEVAANILQRSADPSNPNDVLKAVIETDMTTIIGHVSWKNGPVKNVCRTPLAGGQWRLTHGGPYKYDLVVTETVTAPGISVGSKMEPIVW